MSTNFRVKPSEFIDETFRISFKFNEKTYHGFKGDTLASALLANDVHLVGRSFKYHRPRGIMTAGSEEPNAIVQISDGTDRTEPNVRATEVEIYEGLEASSQNCWPSVNFDIGGINNAISAFLPAGFYYKTFMWPASFWEKYEYLIRHSAGLGKSPTEKDPDVYDHRYIHCDVLVVGAGISGILAAKNAAKNNLKTLLVDEKNEMGGSTIYQNREFNKIENQSSSDWLKKEIKELKNIKNLEIKTRTSVAAFHGYNYLLARENLTDHLEKKDKQGKIRQRLLKIRAKKVILATGALERPLIFNNNDRPGIMLSSAVKKYADFYGVISGKKNVFFTNNDSAYESAFCLHNKGIKVEAIIDIRESSNSKIVKAVEKYGSQCIVASIVVKKSKNETWKVWTDNAREVTNIDALDWITKVQELGVGEILLTSIDNDGTLKGLDFDLISNVPIWLMFIHGLIFATTETAIWQGYLDEKIGQPWSAIVAGLFHWGVWTGSAFFVIITASLLFMMFSLVNWYFRKDKDDLAPALGVHFAYNLIKLGLIVSAGVML